MRAYASRSESTNGRSNSREVSRLGCISCSACLPLMVRSGSPGCFATGRPPQAGQEVVANSLNGTRPPIRLRRTRVASNRGYPLTVRWMDYLRSGGLVSFNDRRLERKSHRPEQTTIGAAGMDKVRWGVLSTAAIGLNKVIPAMQRAQHCEMA